MVATRHRTNTLALPAATRQPAPRFTDGEIAALVRAACSTVAEAGGWELESLARKIAPGVVVKTPRHLTNSDLYMLVGDAYNDKTISSVDQVAIARGYMDLTAKADEYQAEIERLNALVTEQGAKLKAARELGDIHEEHAKRAAAGEREDKAQLKTERDRNRVLEAQLAAAIEVAQSAKNQAAISQASAAEHLDRSRRFARDCESLRFELGVAREKIALLGDQFAEAGAEHQRLEQYTTELANVAQVAVLEAEVAQDALAEEIRARQIAEQERLDAIEEQHALTRRGHVSASLLLHSDPCGALSLMADRLTPPDRSVLDDCEDEPAVDRVATVREVRS